MWCIRKYALVPFKRFYSNLSQNVINLERLNNRSLIEISGEQVWEFLQGLITNDIKHVQNGPSCMFTMMLNTKGRILYDMIVYHTHKTGSLLLECDSNAVDSVMKHISMYRVRRKVDIENLYNKLHIYTLYDSSYISYLRNFENIDPTNEFVAKGESISSTKMHKDLLIYRDPRVENLGYRIIAQSTTDVAKQVRDIWELSTSLPKVNYRWFRYNLGVGEGIADMPPGNCFPLECNCDYLHGVSFHKGCYIGQELTARTYHTGVIRKRFMPLQFTKIPTQLPADHTILHNGVVLGKIRGVEGDVALALLRVHQVLDLDEITVGNGKGKIRKPTWWPLELSKEKMTIK